MGVYFISRITVNHFWSNSVNSNNNSNNFCVIIMINWVSVWVVFTAIWILIYLNRIVWKYHTKIDKEKLE